MVVLNSLLSVLAMAVVVWWFVHPDVESPDGGVDPHWSRDRWIPRYVVRGLCQWLGGFPG